jgi:hypothetical protein
MLIVFLYRRSLTSVAIGDGKEGDGSGGSGAVASSGDGVGVDGTTGHFDPFAPGNLNNISILDHDLDSFEDKPWRKPGADLTDYFNFGFNETTWRAYCIKQKSLREEFGLQKKIGVYDSSSSAIGSNPANYRGGSSNVNSSSNYSNNPTNYQSSRPPRGDYNRRPPQSSNDNYQSSRYHSRDYPTSSDRSRNDYDAPPPPPPPPSSSRSRSRSPRRHVSSYRSRHDELPRSPPR